MTISSTRDAVGAARAALQAGAAKDAIQLLEAFMAGDSPAGEDAEAYVELGHALEQSGAYAQALARFVRGGELARASGDLRLQAMALKGMAKVDYEMGDLQLALARLDEGLALALRLADPVLEGDMLHQLGMTHARLEAFDAAESCFARALEKKRLIGDCRSLAVTMNSLGVLQLSRGNQEDAADAGAAPRHFEAARQQFEAALAIARANGDRHLEALALGNVGTAAGSLGDMALALDLFGRQLATLRELVDPKNEALALTNIGAAHRRTGATAAARQALEEALAIAARIQSTPRARGAHAELARLHEDEGDFREALIHFKAFHRLDRQIRSDDAERRAALVGARLEVDRIRRDAEGFRAERDRLRDANQALAVEAVTDALTGLGNRRSFDRTLARAIRRAPFAGAVAILDIDRFKQVNDRFLHAAGDEVLRRLGRLLLDTVRPTDHAFRIGGEEFALLLAPLAGEAAAICERVRAAVAGHAWHEIAEGLAVTVSIGVTEAQAGEARDKLVARADAALYAAKHGGRDRVVTG